MPGQSRNHGLSLLRDCTCSIQMFLKAPDQYDWHYILVINNYYSMHAKVYVVVAHITCYNSH